MVNYYDGILGGIGTLLIAGATTAALTQPAVLLVFALAAAVLVGHALFRSPVSRELRDNATKSSSPTSVAD